MSGQLSGRIEAIGTRYAKGHRHHSARITEVRLLLAEVDRLRAALEGKGGK